MSKVVEVRLGRTMHELTEDHVFGLLRAFPDRAPSVGLGYGGEAAVVCLHVPDDEAQLLGDNIAQQARNLGLEPSLVEVLESSEYEARAWAEVDVDHG